MPRFQIAVTMRDSAWRVTVQDGNADLTQHDRKFLIRGDAVGYGIALGNAFAKGDDSAELFVEGSPEAGVIWPHRDAFSSSPAPRNK